MSFLCVLSTWNTTHGITSVLCVNAFHIPYTLDGENRGYPVLPSAICVQSASSVNCSQLRCPIYRLGVGYYVLYGVVLRITGENAKKTQKIEVSVNCHSPFEANVSFHQTSCHWQKILKILLRQ